MELLNLTRSLYKLTGKLNLYIALCYQKNTLDKIRLREEINRIKQLISDIGTKIDF